MTCARPWSRGFSAFYGVDWSGAQTPRDRDNGEPLIAIAGVPDRRTRVQFVRPKDGSPFWRQHQVVDWLVEGVNKLREGRAPILIGFDFAFSFPFVDRQAFFPGTGVASSTWRELLEVMRDRVHTDGGFDACSFVDAAPFRSQFVRDAGVDDRDPRLRLRQTEAQSRCHGSKPSSVFLIYGPSQVGKGSVVGIACLAEIKARLPEHVHVWPLDGIAWPAETKAVVVEVYPTMMRKLIGMERAALTNPSSAKPRMSRFGADWRRLEGAVHPPTLSDHEGDALATVLALRHFSRCEPVWRAPAASGADAYALEGWIWGAGAPKNGLPMVTADELPECPARKTNEIARVRWQLEVVAKRRSFVEYSEARAAAEVTGSLVESLRAIQADAGRQHKPDLTCLVVGSEGYPGAGWAGKKTWTAPVHWDWVDVCERVFAEYSVEGQPEGPRLSVDKASKPGRLRRLVLFVTRFFSSRATG